MPNTTAELDRLVNLLDRQIDARPGTGDAIDLVLASRPRDTGVRSLRHDPAVERFRRELTDGIVRVDTVNRLIGLIHTVVTALMTG